MNRYKYLTTKVDKGIWVPIERECPGCAGGKAMGYRLGVWDLACDICHGTKTITEEKRIVFEL